MYKKLIFIFLVFAHFYMFSNENCTSPKKGTFLELIKKDSLTALKASLIGIVFLRKGIARKIGIIAMVWYSRERYEKDFDVGGYENLFSIFVSGFIVGFVGMAN